MKRLLLVALIISLITLPSSSASAGQSKQPTKRALLIGINTYEPAGTNAQHPASCNGGRCDLPTFEDLDGSLNDVEAMVDLITSPRFGFPRDQVTVLANPVPVVCSKTTKRECLPEGVKILPADNTTHDGILRTMEKYLVSDTHEGDTVLFYYSGHGSLRLNSARTKAKAWVSVNHEAKPADNTLVPADAYKGAFDVRDRELQGIWNKAVNNGVNLVAILDSCHSGAISRGVDLVHYKDRALAFDPRDIGKDDEASPPLRPGLSPLVLTASRTDQTAKELAEHGESHGLFTAALVQALNTLPPSTPVVDVFKQVKVVIETKHFDQEPLLDAPDARLRQPLFGGSKSEEVGAAVVDQDSETGDVLLDIGELAGVGPDSEFQSLVADKHGEKIKLKVTALKGITRSLATVVSPAESKVSVGDVFVVTKHVPPPLPKLGVWTWPSLPFAEILGAAKAVTDSGFPIVADPAEEPWTVMLSWEGGAWTLRCGLRPDPTLDNKQVAAADPTRRSEEDVAAACGPWFKKQTISLAGKLRPIDLRANLAPGAKLWLNFPPPQELVAKLHLSEKDSAVQGVSDANSAAYVLAGTLRRQEIAYAWFHRQDYEKSPRLALVRDHSPGCSVDPQSPYPVRTKWVKFSDETREAPVPEEAAQKLDTFAVTLSKVDGYVHLQKDINGTSDPFAYNVIFKHGNTELREGNEARQGEELTMALSKGEGSLRPRYVYVLDINCWGEGQLIYPFSGGNNLFPNHGEEKDEIPLTDAPKITVAEPFGVDTVVVLTTGTPLPDPSILNFEGVNTKGARGVQSDLERLLSSTSGGTRGIKTELPTDWNLKLMSLRSVPR